MNERMKRMTAFVGGRDTYDNNKFIDTFTVCTTICTSLHNRYRIHGCSPQDCHDRRSYLIIGALGWKTRQADSKIKIYRHRRVEYICNFKRFVKICTIKTCPCHLHHHRPIHSQQLPLLVDEEKDGVLELVKHFARLPDLHLL